MFGFLAHYLSESRILDFDYRCGKDSSAIRSHFIGAFSNLFGLVITLGLIAFISIPIIPCKSISRLILLSFAVLIIAKPDSNSLLSNSLLVQLGDISYSVYMIHWPIFEWYRYYDIAAYSFRQKVPYCSKLGGNYF
jgi:peptidoglycan/LPS O-acetylase OafA/YrhL